MAQKMADFQCNQFIRVLLEDRSDAMLKVLPTSIYDQTGNLSWVNVGIGPDTAELAVQSIRRWWIEKGQAVYPQALRLLVAAD